MKDILIRKKIILDSGIQSEIDNELILPFDNLYVGVGTNSDPDHIILQTQEGLSDQIHASILSAHKQIVGDVEVVDEADATTKVEDFNTNGVSLTLKDGTSYANPGTPGDVLFFIGATGSKYKTEEAIILSDGSISLLSTANADDVRLGKVEATQTDHETRIKAREDEDAIILKSDNLKNVATTGSIVLTGTETNKIANREDVRQLASQLTNRLEGANATLDITQLEAADELLRARLDAIEKVNAQGKKVFDTGDTLADGTYAPKKNMELFDNGLVDGSKLDMKAIPATSFDGGVAYVASDFAKDSNGQGPEVQLVIYGDESDPVTTEDSLDVAWTGTQTFGTMRAGKLHGMDFATSHWSANIAVDNNGIITITDFKAADNGGTSYPVKRLILVQSTIDTAQLATVPYYSKTESDTKFADKSVESSKQDSTDAALSTTSKTITGAINENKALLDTTRTTQAQLGAKVLSDGENLLDTAEVIATEKHVDAELATGLAKKQDVLTDALTLTFDDGSTEVVKVGK